jgi:4-amino-4-deoxy-L-arabinose transferase-like glycosyltransferase
MEMYKFFKKWYHIIFLISLIIFHGINNYIWINKNNVYYYIDDYFHLGFSIDIYKMFFSDIKNVNFLFNPAFYEKPLLPFITSVFFYPIFGVSANIAILTNILFLAILLFSTYGIGKKLYNKNTGLLAAFIVSMYPIIFSVSRFYTVYIGVAAFVTLSIYMLLLSNNFRNYKYSLLFGISFGLCELMLLESIIFIIAPLIYVILLSIKKSSKYEKSKIFSNIFISLFFCFLICGFWYIYNIEKYAIPQVKNTHDSLFYKVLSKTIENPIRGLEFFYAFIKNDLSNLLNYQIFILFFALFLVGIIFYVKTKKVNIILLFWMLTPYIILSIFKIVKRQTYIIPILPCVAILSAFWIFELKNKRIQKYIIYFILVTAFIQFLILTYTTLLNDENIIGFNTGEYTNPPSKVYFNENKILNYIIDNSNRSNINVIFLLPSVTDSYKPDKNEWTNVKIINLTYSDKYFNPVILYYDSALKNLPITFYYITLYNYQESFKLLSYADFLIVQTDQINIKEVNETLETFQANNFHIVKTFSITNNSEFTLFKNLNK